MMMMTKAILGTALLGSSLAVAPALSTAQAGSAGPFFVLRVVHQVKERVQALNVTPAQKAEIKSIVRAHKKELRAAANRAFEARMAVADAIHQDTVDEGLIRQRVQEAASAQAELAVLRAKVRTEARGVLTPAQRQGADEIREYVKGAVHQLRTGFQAFVDETLG
ncbi:MAG TPA: Spy/CpxP family protein refolding chaperone [Vicinamibacteria bacterium]|nr:Spy/CpxP family protein refolding chaperone [Vicinamibacteria bacterium]